MEQNAIKKANEWANNKFFEDQSRQEIQNLLDKDDTKEIVDRFYKDMEFGTGGIRGVIGAGINRMNRYNIMKATQALATVLLDLGKEKLKVSVSYDSRRFSDEFAKVTASVLAANGIHAYIYERLNPVCLLSFSVRHHQADAGVMITASHNPPEYNGYKVYWDDGCQVTAPHDQNIINAYGEINDFSTIKIMDFEEGLKQDLIHWVGQDVEQAYLKTIKTKAINPELCLEKGKELKFVYTPIHGTGLIPCTSILNELGLTNYEVVEEQAKPDGNFPTVESPNPENASALKLAVDLMKKNNADVAFGTDPDADRIGVAVNHKGDIHYLSGNQIGSLMLNYICRNKKENGQMPEKPYCVKTIVTTELQTDIANHYGVTIENTLTGFKWICGRMRDIENSDPKRGFLFATEESFGYLNHDQVRDKDGVAPIALLAELTLWYKQRGMTLIDALDELYEQFGFAHETLLCINYYGAEGAAKIKRIMEHFRNNVKEDIVGEKITGIEDFLGDTRYKLPASNVLEFQFESGTKLLLRPSGTEPKIKFYLLIREAKGAELTTSKQNAEKIAEEFVNYLQTESDKC